MQLKIELRNIHALFEAFLPQNPHEYCAFYFRRTVFSPTQRPAPAPATS
jgi:hypothetical protein